MDGYGLGMNTVTAAKAMEANTAVKTEEGCKKAANMGRRGRGWAPLNP